VGFEPTRDFHPCRFSRPVPSTTRPPLQAFANQAASLLRFFSWNLFHLTQNRPPSEGSQGASKPQRTAVCVVLFFSTNCITLISQRRGMAWRSPTRRKAVLSKSNSTVREPSAASSRYRKRLTPDRSAARSRSDGASSRIDEAMTVLTRHFMPPLPSNCRLPSPQFACGGRGHPYRAARNLNPKAWGEMHE
jgi:hypothetical protein